MNKWRWRQPTVDDAKRIIALYAAEKKIESRIDVPPLAQVAPTVEHLTAADNGDIQLVETEAGDLAGTVLYRLVRGDDEILVHCRGQVAPPYRRQGVGHHLIRWAGKAAYTLCRSHAPDKPASIVVTCRGFMTDRIALYEKLGFQLNRAMVQMERSLEHPLPELGMGEETAVSLWSEEQDEAMRLLFNLAFAGAWSVPEMTPDGWRKRFIDTPRFREDLTYLAYRDEQLIGFCLTEDSPGGDESEAWLEAVGVHPDYRRQGIASGLMTMAMKQYQQLGYERAGLDVDASNSTNAMKVYEELGFAEVKRDLMYSCSLVEPEQF